VCTPGSQLGPSQRCPEERRVPLGHDKKTKVDHFIIAMERPQHHKEYQPRLGEFNSFLDRIYIFHPQGKHKTQDCDRLQGFADEVLKMAKASIKRQSLRIPWVTSPKLISRSTISKVAASHTSQGGSRNSQPGRSWQSHPPP
jgi:hypothetical protein